MKGGILCAPKHQCEQTNLRDSEERETAECRPELTPMDKSIANNLYSVSICTCSPAVRRDSGV